MITYPISSNFCNVIGFTVFHFLEAPTRVLRSFSRSLYRVFSYWIFLILFQQENEMKKGKYLGYLLFCSNISLFDVKDFKRNLTLVIWSENVFKANLMFTWHTGKPGHGTLQKTGKPGPKRELIITGFLLRYAKLM